MNTARHIGDDIESHLTWDGAVAAIVDGHRLAAPVIDDTLLRSGDDSLLSRSAWIDGLGALVKSATIVPGNSARHIPNVNGAAVLFADRTGEFEATIDFHLLTRWKTAADSLLAVRRLAAPSPSEILIVGTGAVARSMISAYRTSFPQAQLIVWGRSPERTADFARIHGVDVAADLEAAVRSADVITTATMSVEPLVHGAWLRPGQHLDLIGAFRPDMREVDAAAITRSRVFADARSTALDVGDLAIPLADGLITADHIVADFADLDAFTHSPADITVFENGGGAHLDLMVARYIADITA